MRSIFSAGSKPVLVRAGYRAPFREGKKCITSKKPLIIVHYD